MPPREVGSTLTLGRPLAPPITAWVEFSALGLVTAMHTGIGTAKHGMFLAALKKAGAAS